MNKSTIGRLKIPKANCEHGRRRPTDVLTGLAQNGE